MPLWNLIVTKYVNLNWLWLTFLLFNIIKTVFLNRQCVLLCSQVLSQVTDFQFSIPVSNWWTCQYIPSPPVTIQKKRYTFLIFLNMLPINSREPWFILGYFFFFLATLLEIKKKWFNYSELFLWRNRA